MTTESKESQSGKVWTGTEIKMEQLRAALAIATIASCYYAGSLPLPGENTKSILTAFGGLLSAFWFLYFLLISSSTIHDISLENDPGFVEIFFSERNCQVLKQFGHMVYILGSLAVISIVLMIPLFVILFVILGFAWSLLRL